MKLKITSLRNKESNEPLCVVSWNSPDEILCCGDDRALIKWNLLTKEKEKLAELSNNAFPVDMDVFQKIQGAAAEKSKITFEQILLTTTDGKFHIIGKNNRIEKSVEAHRGAVLVGKWSPDSTSLLTGGEDGYVKIWSRTGMLRTTIVKESVPIYSAAWGSDSNRILYANNKMLAIKATNANVKSIKWKAHDGLILKVCWSPRNNLIISGGEDCRYKIWDEYGRQLYGSVIQDYPVTSLSWSPNGTLFLVGSFNTLRLCDKAGWPHVMEKHHCGSSYNVSWSSDDTRIASACADGTLLLAHVIQRRFQWSHYEAVQEGKKSVVVTNARNDISEKLEFPERVVRAAMDFKHLVVVTATQCYIYNVNNFNTPNISDLKDVSVSLISLAEKHFLLATRSYVDIYNYDGKVVFSPKWPNMRCDLISASGVSLSDDVVAIKDQIDDKIVHLLEIGSSVVVSQPVTHSTGVIQLSLNQSPRERHLAFVDRNHDLYLVNAGKTANPRKSKKLGSMIEDIKWHRESNVLAGLHDKTLIVWYYPGIVFVDANLLRKSTLVKEGEFGRNPSIVGVEGNRVEVRKSDGSVVNDTFSPFSLVLHSTKASGKNLQGALKLCRTLKEETLWACLAGLSVREENFDIAEECYGALKLFDKLAFIQRVKKIKTKCVRSAEMYSFSGNVDEAESVLLQNGFIFRAIFLNVLTHRWNRALELAVKHKTHVDTVLLRRKKYLKSFDKEETNGKFIQFQEMEINEETIEKKIASEFQKEI